MHEAYNQAGNVRRAQSYRKYRKNYQLAALAGDAVCSIVRAFSSLYASDSIKSLQTDIQSFNLNFQMKLVASDDALRWCQSYSLRARTCPAIRSYSISTRIWVLIIHWTVQLHADLGDINQKVYLCIFELTGISDKYLNILEKKYLMKLKVGLFGCRGHIALNVAYVNMWNVKILRISLPTIFSFVASAFPLMVHEGVTMLI